jgi:hypothetical protein
MSRSSQGTRFAAWYPRVMLVVACFWFSSLYCTNRPPYIDLARYAHGAERMPFQGRDLMRWPMLAASHSVRLQHLTANRAVLHSPEFLVMELAAAVSLLLAGVAANRIYRLAAANAPLPELPFAILVVLCLFNFVLGVPFSFPYDLPATAFLGWGSYFALQRRFWPLLPLFAVGTLNRETTLFLVGVYAVSLATTGDGRLDLRQLRIGDYARLTVLVLLWALETGFQKHLYRANPTEAGPRIAGNLHALANPLLWPNILSASAFLLPWVYVFRHRIAYAPLRNTLLLLPFWVLLLLSVGQILELRIYGDISCVIAAAAALILVSLAQPGSAAPGTTAAS